MSLEAQLQSHEAAIRYLLDSQVAASGRAKADIFVIRKLIDALATSGLLDIKPFNAALSDAVITARSVPTYDSVTGALWVSFAERLTEIMGEAAPAKPKGS